MRPGSRGTVGVPPLIVFLLDDGPFPRWERAFVVGAVGLRRGSGRCRVGVGPSGAGLRGLA